MAFPFNSYLKIKVSKIIGLNPPPPYPGYEKVALLIYLSLVLPSSLQSYRRINLKSCKILNIKCLQVVKVNLIIYKTRMLTTEMC